jgi:alcohol dehydrogenase, propanol-preferring
MSSINKVGVVHSPGERVTFEVKSIPSPRDEELLMKVLATGVCHTDLHAIEGDIGNPDEIFPITPCHEGVGVVHRMGA